MGHKHEVVDADARFVIVASSRAINRASGSKNGLMQFDHNSERYTFEMPRTIEGHDMLECNRVEVHYLNIENGTKKEHSGLYEVTDLRVSPDDETKAVFSWLISRGATQYHGKLSFLVSFACVEDGVVEYAWHTNVHSDTPINKGIDASGAFEEEYVEIIERWKNSVMAHFEDDIAKWKYKASTEIRQEASSEIASNINSFKGEWTTALEVERKRIDAFVALEDGSTTGDAELIDARIDSEGYVYKNLGSSMRTQTQDIASELSTLIEEGDNLINPNEMIIGQFVNQTDGTIHTGSTHRVTKYLRVKPNTEYFLDTFMNNSLQESDTSKRYALYDADKTYISGGVNVRRFTTPENAKYVRVSISSNYMATLQSIGETQYYIPYSKSIASGLYESGCANVFADKLAEMTDTTENLFNPNEVTAGYFVNQETGELLENRNHIVSGFIEIKNDATYSFGFCKEGVYTDEHHEFRYALYDRNKKFITGGYKSFSFTAPSMAKYVRISYYHTAPEMMFCQSTELSDFVAFKKTLKPYLVDGYTKAEIDKMLGIDPDSMPFNLPSAVYGLVGEELNIYFDNLVDGHDCDYLFNVTCGIGRQMERCYRVTPTETGEYSLTIEAVRKKDGVGVQKTCSLKITDKTARTESVSVLVIGDSTTANGICVGKLADNFAGDETELRLVGTRGNAPALHEGRSGWTFNQFVNVSKDANVESVTNAFYNPNTGIFDMAYYLSSNGIVPPNYAFINLGINDCFNYQTDEELLTAVETIISYCDVMIGSIREACPNTKIGIALTIPPNYSQDAFGKGYNCGQTRARYKRNNVLWVRKLIDLYDGKESENIYLVPIHTNLDTVNNMGMEEVKVNKRSEKTHFSPVSNGGVHPDESGYWQIADAYWFFIKNQS